MADPRIRGIVEYRGTIIPTVNKSAGVPLGSAVRIGSVVRFANQERVVQYINIEYRGIDTVQAPGVRQVINLNLGDPYATVPVDCVTVVKY